jgi:D-3-phosphoglycerate dehydrogenase
VVERLRGWEAQLLYFDPYVMQEQAPAGTMRVMLDELLQRADFVSLHVTLTAETQGLIGTRELDLMKPTAYLVNTSRGAAIDEAALCRALQERRIAGAALDTFMHEPLPADSPLRAFVGGDNVILTPHIIGQGREAMDSLRTAIAENVRRILRGEPALYTKNPEVFARWQERIARLA